MPDASLGADRKEDLLSYLKQLGFEGPYAGGKNQFVVKGDLSLRIPNPHQADIGKELLTRILRQAGISRDAWEKL